MGKKSNISLIAIAGRVFAFCGIVAAFGGAASADSLFPQETSVGLDGVGYLHSGSEGPQAYQSAFMPQLMGRWADRGQIEWFEWGGQADGLLMFSGMSQSPSNVSPYLELPELYAGFSLQVLPVQALVGRKLEQWSHLDEQWSLGIWQPRFRWDYIHPEQVGLSGVFFRVEQPLFKIVAMVSPMFVPERGVNISSANGALSSDSRWFIPPPSTMDVLGERTAAKYTLMTPDIASLVMHAGGSAMARVGRETGFWGSAGFAYKPMNQLLLASDGRLRLTGSADTIHADARVYPRVVYHQLYSAEAGYQNDRVSGWISTLIEEPFRDTTPAMWTTQEVRSSVAASAAVDFRVLGPRKRATWMNLSYLRQWGGNAADRGPYAMASNTFDARYPYQSALGLSVRTEMFTNIFAKTRVTYDIGHQGAIWSTEVRYTPARNWMVGLGADLLASERNEDPENADLIGRFNANDRIHAGVTYVF